MALYFDGILKFKSRIAKIFHETGKGSYNGKY